MRESLLERMQPGGGPFIVIGHSQGSIIAFDVLSDLDPNKYRVPLFVTIGSPLGIAEVQDQVKILLGKSRLTVPRCVQHWLNVCDPGDPVAADSTLRDDFSGGSVIEDVEAVNLDSPAHPHSGSGYLRLDVVRRAVRDAVHSISFNQSPRLSSPGIWCGGWRMRRVKRVTRSSSSSSTRRRYVRWKPP